MPSTRRRSRTVSPTGRSEAARRRPTGPGYRFAGRSDIGAGPQRETQEGPGRFVEMEERDFAAYAGARVLITGGLGFIGSALAQRLVDLGSDVLLVDSLIPEYGGNPFNIADIA